VSDKNFTKIDFQWRFFDDFEPLQHHSIFEGCLLVAKSKMPKNADRATNAAVVAARAMASVHMQAHVPLPPPPSLCGFKT